MIDHSSQFYSLWKNDGGLVNGFFLGISVNGGGCDEFVAQHLLE